jgi:predicted O-methyltransferase YrrM
MRKIFQFAKSLVTISIRRPADLRHVFGVANSTAANIVDPAADVRGFPEVSLEELAPGSRFTFQLFPRAEASITLYEAAALAALMVRTKAKRIFEFGTYKGVSTTQLALNLPTSGELFTLDLPPEQTIGTLRTDKLAERSIASDPAKGTFIPHELREKITFLKCDSARFDVTPYFETMDLVFVDGAHSYEYVANDTAKGLAMLQCGGAIAWHDCAPNHRDVVRFLQQSGLSIQLVRGTALAFAFRN